MRCKKKFVRLAGFVACLAFLFFGSLQAHAREDYFTPALGDIDAASPGLERVMSTPEGGINALAASGDLLSGFPLFITNATVASSPVLVDMTGDGLKEIVFITRSAANAYVLHVYTGKAQVLGSLSLGSTAIYYDPVPWRVPGAIKNSVIVSSVLGEHTRIDFKDGGVKSTQLFSTQKPSGVATLSNGQILVVNFPQEKKMEVYIVGSEAPSLMSTFSLSQAVLYPFLMSADNKIGYGVTAAKELIAVDTATGKMMNGFPVVLPALAIGSPVLADVTGDTQNEIIVPLSTGEQFAATLQGVAVSTSLPTASFLESSLPASSSQDNGLFSSMHSYASQVVQKVERRIVSLLSRIKFALVKSPTSMMELATADGTGLVSGTSFNMGNAAMNKAKLITITIRNTGSAALVLSGSPLVQISGTNASEVQISAQPTISSLPAGGETTFTVTFKPSSVGSKTAVLSIANNSETKTYTITLTGTAVATFTGIWPTKADINGDGAITVADISCHSRLALWELGGKVGAPPECAIPAALTNGDLNCDKALNVTDTVILNQLVLGLLECTPTTSCPALLNGVIDANQNNIVDSCENT